MKYFFILGNNSTLSFTEIVSVLQLKPEQVLFLSETSLVVDIEEELEVEELIRRLGGTIKIGAVNDQFSIINVQSIFNEQIFNDAKSGVKFSFGISYYGPASASLRRGKKNKLKNEKNLAMEIKKALKEKGISSRWVTSRDKTLSSVVVEQNKLTTDKGVEIVIINNDGQFYIGKTLAVQPFKELSKRDYGRPGRDDCSGMLPPKLAQILINFASALTPNPSPRGRGELVLLDPFCGSGTVLTEAALMGYRNLIGCDKSERAVSDTRENFQFTIFNFHSIFNSKISNDQLRLSQCDVRQLLDKIKANSVDVIVTEPYLGPSRIKRDRASMEKVVSELEQLYHEAILQFEKVLKNKACATKLQRRGGRVVMIWPVFIVNNEKIFLNTKNILKNSSFQKVNLIEPFKNKVLQLTNRNTIVYRREGQKVEREILVLEK